MLPSRPSNWHMKHYPKQFSTLQNTSAPKDEFHVFAPEFGTDSVIIPGSWISPPHPLQSSKSKSYSCVSIQGHRLSAATSPNHGLPVQNQENNYNNKNCKFSKRIHPCHLNSEQSKVTGIASHCHVRVSTKRQNKPQFCGKNGISTKWLPVFLRQ